MNTIRPIETRDCSQIAGLHLEYLPTPFTGRAGSELLKIYYASLIPSGGAIGFVAVEGDEVLGYICGVFDPARVKKYLLVHHFILLPIWGAIAILSKPGMLVDFSSRLSGTEGAQSGTLTDRLSNCYELRPIVVSPAERGQGVAKLLLVELIQDATQRGYDRVYCLTETDNSIANRFYQKNAFHKTGAFLRSGRFYTGYERIIDESI